MRSNNHIFTFYFQYYIEKLQKYQKFLCCKRKNFAILRLFYSLSEKNQYQNISAFIPKIFSKLSSYYVLSSFHFRLICFKPFFILKNIFLRNTKKRRILRLTAKAIAPIHHGLSGDGSVRTKAEKILFHKVFFL